MDWLIGSPALAVVLPLAFCLRLVESGDEIGESPCLDRLAQTFQEVGIILQIVPGQQHAREDFAGLAQMMEISTAVPGASRAGAFGIERPLILGMPRIPEIDRAASREGLCR